MFEKFGIGFDAFDFRQSVIDAAKRSAEMAYPPYNIRKVSDSKYVIEIAAAGFHLNDFEITIDDAVLTINCASSDKTDDYLWHGISSKNWVRSFVLNDNVTVKSSVYHNGMLKIWLEHNLPAKKAPLKINIQQPTAQDTRTLLNEDSNF